MSEDAVAVAETDDGFEKHEFCYGVRPDGTVTTEKFKSRPGESWIWIDEQILTPDDADDEERRKAVFCDQHHLPPRYAAKSVVLGEQAVIVSTSTHDHIVIPDLDLESPGSQLVSVVLHTHKLHTRHAGTVAALKDLRRDRVFLKRAPEERTTAFVLTSILQITLDQIDKRQNGLSDELRALEERIAGRFISRSDARLTLLAVRHELARYRKLYDGFQRIAGALLDLRCGAFAEAGADVQSVIRSETQRHFSRLRDHIARGSDRVREFRDTVRALDDLLRAQQADDLNDIVLVLTGVSAAALPVAAVSGFFGMNVTFPGRDDAIGLRYALYWIIGLSVFVWCGLFPWVVRKRSGRARRVRGLTSWLAARLKRSDPRRSDGRGLTSR